MIVTHDLRKKIELYFANEMQGNIKIFTDNRDFCRTINKKPEKCNNYCTDTDIIASNMQNIIDTALLKIKFNIVKQRREPEEVQQDNRGLRLCEVCNRRSKEV